MGATPFPIDYQTFITRCPEFSGVETSLIQGNLDAAAQMIDQSVWGNLAGDGHMYLTAHRLALSPFGSNARIVVNDDGSTTYQRHYQEMVRIVGYGFRVT